MSQRTRRKRRRMTAKQRAKLQRGCFREQTLAQDVVDHMKNPGLGNDGHGEWVLRDHQGREWRSTKPVVVGSGGVVQLEGMGDGESAIVSITPPQ